MSTGRLSAMAARRGGPMSPQRLSFQALFTIVYITGASSVYFAIGVVANRALGLTPVVFLVGGLFFGLAAMTYVEGASLHAERGGSAVFARYAFNELVSFVAGWVILLDYVILVAATALAATNYIAAFWAPLGRGALEVVLAVAIIAGVTAMNVMGLSARRLQRLAPIAFFDLVLQLVVIVLGLVLVFRPAALVHSIDLGRTPRWTDLIFALTIAPIAFTGLEAASGLAGEVTVGRRNLRRLVSAMTATVVVVYVGISLVAASALGLAHPEMLPPSIVKAPIVGVVGAYHPHALARILTYVVAAAATVTLIAAANSAMLGLSRLGYSLATNRQIPSALGRLERSRGTPFVIIGAAALLAVALVIPADLELVVGIYAFGAMLAFTIAHLSVCVLRYREPDRDRPYRMPGSVRIGRGDLPIPAVIGVVLSAAGWVSVLVLHTGARLVGGLWLMGGLALYVIYRTSGGKPLLTRVTVPERALREEARAPEFGSILVPIFGEALDDDIVQTAGRLAGDEHDDVEAQGAVIEALWVYEVPMALPLDAPLPDAQRQRARQALARAKAVGEEYEGVEVATATVRARRAGQAIVDQARRRGVEAIVLAAEEPSRIRGGTLLGGLGLPLDNYVGDVTKYVVRKAPCRVILTAPAADGSPAPDGESGAGSAAGGEDSERAGASTPARPPAPDPAEHSPGDPRPY